MPDSPFRAEKQRTFQIIILFSLFLSLPIGLISFQSIQLSESALVEAHPMRYGIDVTHWDLDIEKGLPNQKAVLNNVEVMGVEWVRVGIWYDRVIRSDSWKGLDSYVSDCNTHDLKILANLLCWMDIYNLTQWLSFVEMVASRYRGRIDAYQIFNEQDDPTPDSIWPTQMSFNKHPDTYAEFLTASYNTIKRIDPNATIVMGGTTTLDDGSYVEKVLEKGGECDAVATHFYGTIPDIEAKLIPKVLRLEALKKPVWITEAGQDSSLGVGYQKEWMKRTFTALRMSGVETAFFFTYPYLTEAGSMYGSPTEAYQGFKELIKVSEG